MTVRKILNLVLSPVYGAILMHHEIQYGRCSYTVQEWF